MRHSHEFGTIYQVIDPSAFLNPLEQAVRDTELHVATDGWDQPTRLFVLAPTTTVLADNPHLAATTDTPLEDLPNGHLTAIEQDQLPPHSNLEGLLGGIEFGPAVHGVVIATERIMVPPEAQTDLPKDTTKAVEALMAHPARQDVRLVVGVLRGGDRSCALRTRAYDHADSVATGTDLVPGLAEALLSTLPERD